MKRESGYYWVKINNGPWETAEWDSERKAWYYRDEWSDQVDWNFTEFNETRISNPDEKKSIQAIVRLDDEIISYLYDEKIEEIVSSCVKTSLRLQGKITNAAKVETKLYTPPLKVWDIYPNLKKDEQ